MTKIKKWLIIRLCSILGLCALTGLPWLQKKRKTRQSTAISERWWQWWNGRRRKSTLYVIRFLMSKNLRRTKWIRILLSRTNSRRCFLRIGKKSGIIASYCTANKLVALTGMRVCEVLGLKCEFLFDDHIYVCAQHYNKYGYRDKIRLNTISCWLGYCGRLEKIEKGKRGRFSVFPGCGWSAAKTM